ncbi:MAG: S8/S53 family peptidase [Bacteroidales bacterium]|nr:S8/S53 family peptidase [Bacteroidales bacterium]
MKKIIIFCLFYFNVGVAIQAQDCCYPDKDGMYSYYINVKENNIKKSFSKDSLMHTLKKSKFFLNKDAKNYDKDIKVVYKSFPTAKTKLLQQSVTIRSYNSNLDIELSKYSDVFNFVEKICHPKDMLLYEPNDYSYLGEEASDHLDLIKAPQAWEITKSDSRILVGVTDNYIEPSHEDLENKISQILCNGTTPDFHGIAVSGCAAAHTDNYKGLASIGFNSKIIFSSHWANDNEVLEMAQIPGVRVINCSWINSCSYSSTADALYQEIRDVHNVVLTFGAGNGVNHCGSLTAYVYPASYESVICVTSVGHSTDYGTVLPIYGKHLWKDCHESTIGDSLSAYHHNDKVDICAPGYRVVSPSLNNSYTNAWGTSFSAPIVAGVCALVASVNPCLTAAEIQDIVISSADTTIYNIPENAAYIGLLGKGRIDAYAAVKKAVELGTVYIQNRTYNSTLVETAETELKSGNSVTNLQPNGNVIIETGSNVTFRATRSIELSPGFEVKLGATFNTEIYESPCF